jgi:hypothetical protein
MMRDVGEGTYIRAAKVLDEAEGSTRTAPYVLLVCVVEIGTGVQTKVVAAGLAKIGVDAEAGFRVSLRNTLDVALAKSFDAVGTRSGGLIGVKGLSLVDAAVGSEHVVGSFGKTECRGGSEEEGGAHFGGGRLSRKRGRGVLSECKSPVANE